MLEIKQIRRAEALRYMGYGKASPDEKISCIIDDCEKKLLAAAKPVYTYKVFDIDRSNGISVGGVILSGKSIFEHLDGCVKAAIMCATLSSAADKLIRAAEVSDMTAAIVLDNLANAMIEQVCDEAEKEIAEKATGYYMTWRFSAGYGDLPIEIQENLLRIIDAEKRVGVCASENSLMMPRKSVSAIIGLSDRPIERQKQGCQSCNMKGSCQFRERGERCGN